MLQPGTVVDGKFEVLEMLSRGAFGVIYKARQVGFERKVALKMMLVPEPDLQSEFLRRFEREGRILCSLQHNNLPAFHGFGVFEQCPYIAMAFIEGDDLELVLNRSGKLTFHETATILKQVASALICVHDHGIVHRDIKPANIMLCSNKGVTEVKLIDFGLAKATSDLQKLTQTGLTVGTTEYMSPEQCMGKQADNRSDIYSLGCILQHCLTGKPPFEGDNEIAIMRQHVDSAPPRLARLADVPQAAQYIVDKALAKEPNDRYQSMDDMLRDIDALDSGRRPPVAYGAPVARSQRGISKTTARSLFLLGCIIFSGAFGVALSFYFLDHNTDAANNEKQFPVHEKNSAEYFFDYSRVVDQFGKIYYTDRAAGKELSKTGIVLGENALKANQRDHLLAPNKVAWLCAWMAKMYACVGEHRKAADTGAKAIQTFLSENIRHSDLIFACADYVTSCEALHSPEDAVSLLERVVARTKMCHFELARAYAGAGQYDKALATLDTARQWRGGSSPDIDLLTRQIASMKLLQARSTPKRSGGE